MWSRSLCTYSTACAARTFGRTVVDRSHAPRTHRANAIHTAYHDYRDDLHACPCRLGHGALPRHIRRVCCLHRSRCDRALVYSRASLHTRSDEAAAATPLLPCLGSPTPSHRSTSPEHPHTSLLSTSQPSGAPSSESSDALCTEAETATVSSRSCSPRTRIDAPVRVGDWSLSAARFGLRVSLTESSAPSTPLLTWEEGVLQASLAQAKDASHRQTENDEDEDHHYNVNTCAGEMSRGVTERRPHGPAFTEVSHTDHHFAWIMGECKFLRVLLLRYLHHPHLWRDAKDELMELAMESVRTESRAVDTLPSLTGNASHETCAPTEVKQPTSNTVVDMGKHNTECDARAAHDANDDTYRVRVMNSDRMVFFGPGMRHLFYTTLLSADATTFTGSAAVWCAFVLSQRHTYPLLASPQRIPFSFGEVHPTVTRGDLDRRRAGVRRASLTSRRCDGWWWCKRRGDEADRPTMHTCNGVAHVSRDAEKAAHSSLTAAAAAAADGDDADTLDTSRMGSCETVQCTPAPNENDANQVTPTVSTGEETAVAVEWGSPCEERALNEKLFGKVGADFAARVSGHQGIYIGYHVSTIPASVGYHYGGIHPLCTTRAPVSHTESKGVTDRDDDSEKESDAASISHAGENVFTTSTEDAEDEENQSEDEEEEDETDEEMQRARMYDIDYTYLSIVDPLVDMNESTHSPAPTPSSQPATQTDAPGGGGDARQMDRDVQLTQLWPLFQKTEVSQLIDQFIYARERLPAVQRAIRAEMAEQLAFRLLFFSLEAVRAVTAPAVTYGRLWTLHRELRALLREEGGGWWCKRIPATAAPPAPF